jgi:hypothetical protein
MMILLPMSLFIKSHEPNIKIDGYGMTYLVFVVVFLVFVVDSEGIFDVKLFSNI